MLKSGDARVAMIGFPSGTVADLTVFNPLRIYWLNGQCCGDVPF